MANGGRCLTVSSGLEVGADGSQDMNAYLAEFIAADRMAELLREAEAAQLIRDARRPRANAATSGSMRMAAILAAAAFIVTLWLGLAA
jgi:hypothetical protein